MDLIARGVPPRLTRYEGRTPLHIAAERGHVEMVRFLVGCEARIDAADDKGWTPLMLAMEGNHEAVVEHLVESGATLTLAAAAYVGDTTAASRFLAGGVDVNARTIGRQTPLHLAALSGRQSMVELLITRGAEVGAVTQWGDTALHVAVANRHAEIARLLLAKGAQVNAKAEYERMPLHVAVKVGDPNLVDLLISAGADVNAGSGYRGRPLHLAAKKGEIRIVRTLLAAGADASAGTPLTAAYEALSEGHIDLVGLLLDHCSDAEGKIADPCHATQLLTLAIEGGRIDMMELLIPRIRDINACVPLQTALGINRYLLKDAMESQFCDPNLPYYERGAMAERMAHSRWIGMLNLLLNHGADPNTVSPGHVEYWGRRGTRCRIENPTPLHVAGVQGDAHVIRMLICLGVDVDAKDRQGLTPLYHALRARNGETARVLMDAGAQPVVVRNEPGEMMLHEALRGFRADLVLALALLDNGADPNERDLDGETALHVAAGQGYVEPGRSLIAHHADVNARNAAGKTPLHLAVRSDCVDLVSDLLTHGANVNAPDDSGDTPLHSAALRGHRKAVELLLSHKADPNLRNSRGRTPRDEAVRRGHTEVVQLLTVKPRPSKESEK
jgi:ankyrin repeat protein